MEAKRGQRGSNALAHLRTACSERATHVTTIYVAVNRLPPFNSSPGQAALEQTQRSLACHQVRAKGGRTVLTRQQQQMNQQPTRAPRVNEQRADRRHYSVHGSRIGHGECDVHVAHQPAAAAAARLQWADAAVRVAAVAAWVRRLR